MKETDRWESCKQVVLCPSFNKKMPKILRAFHTLLTELSTEDRQRFTIFERMDKEAFEAIFTLFIPCLCLQKFTFTFDATGYMNDKHIYDTF